MNRPMSSQAGASRAKAGSRAGSVKGATQKAGGRDKARSVTVGTELKT